MSEVEQSFDLNAAAEEIISNESTEAQSPEGSAVEGDKPEASTTDSTIEKDLSPDEILSKLGEEKADPKASEELLNHINAMGITRNGQQVKIENNDQLKELLQKGSDYTYKLMQHSEEAKAFQESKAKFETEYKQKETQLQEKESQLAETVYENQIMEAVIAEIQNSDPDYFEDIKRRYQAEANRRNQAMPYVKQFESKFQELNGEIQNLKGEKVKNELTGIKNTWETDLTATQTKLAPMLNKLGVKVDYEKVKAAWQNDASNSLTVEQALNAVYGSEINKAFQSYQKLLATKNKTNVAMLKRTGASGNQGGKEADQSYKVGDYESMLKDSSSTM